MNDAPSLFRMILHVTDTSRAAGFYTQLLGTEGRAVAPTRHYFDCGPVILDQPRLRLLFGRRSRSGARPGERARLPVPRRGARHERGSHRHPSLGRALLLRLRSVRQRTLLRRRADGLYGPAVTVGINVGRLLLAGRMAAREAQTPGRRESAPPAPPQREG